MTTARAYRGKYPQRIRIVSCGVDRIVHLYTNDGGHYALTMAQARSVNANALPSPGDDVTPYRMAQVAMPVLDVPATARKDIRPENWSALADSLMRALTKIRVTGTQAQELTARVLTTGARDLEAAKKSAAFQKIMASFSGAGAGSTLGSSLNTGWGWLNAVTDYVDHEARAYSDEHRQVAAQWGQGDQLKNKAFELISA